MDIKNDLEKMIYKNRPKLGDSSVKTYISILTNLFKKLNFENIDDFMRKDKEIMTLLDEKNPQTRKTALSALFILTGNEIYREKMLQDCKIVNETYKEQKKTKTQKENWLSFEKIKETYDDYLLKVNKMFSNKLPLDYQVIVSFFLLAFLSGCSGLPPRRSLDYALLKIDNFDEKTDNYCKKGKLYFNNYKTMKHYGTQVIDVPDELNKLIKKWKKINTTDFLLFSSNEKQLTSPQITRIFNKIFDKKISTDMLRHIYLGHYYEKMHPIKEMENVANEMGHSINTALQYVKYD